MSLAPCCSLCGSVKHLSRCAACKVTLYCSREHQVADRETHAPICKAVKKARDFTQHEEQKLRDHPGDFMTEPNPFENSVGHFWGIFNTRAYMRARYALVEALLKIKTFDAVKTVADHLLDMLRLCRSDNMGLRDIVPNVLLRLGRDQQCYDFVKWWAVHDPDGNYDTGDMSLPYLNVVDADVFESPDYLCGKYPSLSHTVAVILLKIKLLLDLKALSRSTFLVKKLPQELADRVRLFIPLSSIIWKDSNIMATAEHKDLIRDLSQQVETLFEAISQANKHFWPALLNPGAHLSARPEAYSQGGEREMQLKLQHCYDSWIETPGAIDIIKEKIEGCNMIEVSDGSDAGEVEWESEDEATKEEMNSKRSTVARSSSRRAS